MDQVTQSPKEETPAELQEQVSELERALAARYKIRGAVRLGLLRGLRTGEIPEDSLVIQWLALSASLFAMLRSDRPPLLGPGVEEKEAANGGLFFCPGAPQFGEIAQP
jgi:hypothetical protein